MKIISNLKLFLFCTLILGFVYPVMIFWVSDTLFTVKSHGSILRLDKHILGSELIGQDFKSNKYFHGRPSASDYNALASGGTNLSPISKILKEKIEKQKQLGFNNEMLFSSGSGLDPHISKDSAILQVDRVLVERKWSEIEKKKLIDLINKEALEEDQRIFGNSKINVLRLNIAMDNNLSE